MTSELNRLIDLLNGYIEFNTTGLSNISYISTSDAIDIEKILASLASVAEDEPAKYEASELVISGTGPQLKTVTSNEFGSIREEYADYWLNKAMQLAVENEELTKDCQNFGKQIDNLAKGLRYMCERFDISINDVDAAIQGGKY